MTERSHDYYVPRHEWEKCNGEIRDLINTVDNRHFGLHSDLKILVTTLTGTTSQLLESQKETNGHLSNLNTNMQGFNERLINNERDVQETREDLEEVKNSVTEKQKGNATIITSIIGGVVSIIVAAFGFAQIFF